MMTIDIALDEAAQDLAGVIRRLREIGGRVVLKDDGGPVAEITLVVRSNPIGANATQSVNSVESEMQPQESRYVRSEFTGLWVVAGRPGQRMVTSEEIYEELRGSGP